MISIIGFPIVNRRRIEMAMKSNRNESSHARKPERRSFRETFFFISFFLFSETTVNEGGEKKPNQTKQKENKSFNTSSCIHAGMGPTCVCVCVCVCVCERAEKAMTLMTTAMRTVMGRHVASRRGSARVGAAGARRWPPPPAAGRVRNATLRCRLMSSVGRHLIGAARCRFTATHLIVVFSFSLSLSLSVCVFFFLHSSAAVRAKPSGKRETNLPRNGPFLLPSFFSFGISCFFFNSEFLFLSLPKIARVAIFSFRFVFFHYFFF